MDIDESTQAKVDQLAELVKSSKHMVAIVGAGISTACGIPDFRGPKGMLFMYNTPILEAFITINLFTVVLVLIQVQ